MKVINYTIGFSTFQYKVRTYNGKISILKLPKSTIVLQTRRELKNSYRNR